MENIMSPFVKAIVCAIGGTGIPAHALEKLPTEQVQPASVEHVVQAAFRSGTEINCPSGKKIWIEDARQTLND